jgi:hypothetical protein
MRDHQHSAINKITSHLKKVRKRKKNSVDSFCGLTLATTLKKIIMK